MPEKSVREMTWRERRIYSLEARTFWGSIIGSVIVGLVAFLIGLGLFTYALIGQYAAEAFSLCRSTAFVVDKIVNVEDLSGKVMEIYKGLYREDLEKTGTEEYRQHFASITETGSYQYLLSVLRDFRNNSDVQDLYLAMYDNPTSSLVMIADSNTDPETLLYAGDRKPAGKKERNTFLNWNGEGRLYSYVKNPLHGRMCTAGMPLKNSAGETVAFVMADVTMENVAAGMKTFAFFFILVLATVMFVYSYIVTRHTKKTVIDPINSIAEACQEYMKDKREDRGFKDRFSMLNIHTGDEIENLALTMADMEKDLAEYVDDLTAVTAEKERVSTELDMAGKIQASMLPHIFPPYPEREEFDLFASMEPAKETGGDFYDFFLIDDDHLCVVMADVSGKGVPAALFMMVSKVIIQSCAMLGKSAAEILSKTNDALCSNNQMQMFVTAWLGILEISTGKFTAANAGHEYPVLRHEGGTYEIMKDSHGFVLGGFEDEFYQEYQFQMKPGSRLFLYTDGVPEAMNKDRESFGMDRMLRALNKDPEAAPTEVLGNVRAAVNDFVQDAEQFDDLTMLCLEFYGKKEEN